MAKIPYRPAISDILIKANANIVFRTKLLSGEEEVLAELDIPPEDAAILTGIRAANLKDYASQIKARLLVSDLHDDRPYSSQQGVASSYPISAFVYASPDC
ncbi:MAG: hypothetical protein JW953_18390 [Anaerolineae bacterium]|nr:hypothetical protein [Anaerolineae bacterium]